LTKALEDLTINYDYSVRYTYKSLFFFYYANTFYFSNRTCDGEIVQFIYGQDGLEPLKMEDKDKPVNFDRLLKYCKTIYKLNYAIDRVLYPWEIIEIANEKMY
jgi:DNA-directed RNA polymerase III subunit RPC1